MNNTKNATEPLPSSDWFGALVEIMKRVEEWEIDRYRLTHKPTGFMLWIANGWVFLEAAEDSQIQPSIPLLKRRRLWQHVKWLRSAIATQKLSAPNDQAER